MGGGREGVGDVVGGVVPGDLVHSLGGGMKPSPSALASVLTYCMLFLNKEAFDTVICTGEMIWMSILYVSCTW